MDREAPAPSHVDGQYVIGRWTRDFSGNSGAQAQAYFDRSYRRIPSSFKEDLRIYDFDFQQHFPLGGWNALIWGTGYRLMDDAVTNSPAIAFLPGDKTLNLYNAFLQDQITVIPEKVKLTLGSKVEHNDYSGLRLIGGPDFTAASHPEFGPEAGRNEVPRSVSGRATCRF